MIPTGQGVSIKSSPAFRWTVGVGAGAVLALSLVLLFLLTQATGNRELYERNYGRLLVLNIAVAALLLMVIGWIVLRLYLRLRQGRFTGNEAGHLVGKIMRMSHQLQSLRGSSICRIRRACRALL